MHIYLKTILKTIFKNKKFLSVYVPEIYKQNTAFIKFI
jgi:hypothetical protein